MKLLTHTAVGMFFGAVFYYLLNLGYWFYFVVGFSAFIPVGGYLYDTISFATPFLLSILLMTVNISIIWYRKRRKS